MSRQRAATKADENIRYVNVYARPCGALVYGRPRRSRREADQIARVERSAGNPPAYRLNVRLKQPLPKGWDA